MKIIISICITILVVLGCYTQSSIAITSNTIIGKDVLITIDLNSIIPRGGNIYSLESVWQYKMPYTTDGVTVDTEASLDYVDCNERMIGSLAMVYLHQGQPVDSFNHSDKKVPIFRYSVEEDTAQGKLVQTICSVP